MTEPTNDLAEQLRRIRYDLTAAQAKLTDAMELAARLGPTTPRPRCPECGVELRGRNALAEHAYHAHGGPVPEHWERAEQQAVEAMEAAKEGVVA